MDVGSCGSHDPHELNDTMNLEPLELNGRMLAGAKPHLSRLGVVDDVLHIRSALTVAARVTLLAAFGDSECCVVTTRAERAVIVTLQLDSITFNDLAAVRTPKELANGIGNRQHPVWPEAHRRSSANAYQLLCDHLPRDAVAQSDRDDAAQSFSESLDVRTRTPNDEKELYGLAILLGREYTKVSVGRIGFQ
jgi:hypothetical protein